MIIEGNIINLRNLRMSDAVSIFNAFGDKRVVAYTSLPNPFRMKDAVDLIQNSRRGMKSKDSYILGIESKETGMIIGIAGLKKINYEHSHAILLCWLGKKYWGKGIGTEACRLMLSFGFRKLKLRRIAAWVFPQNKASLSMVKKLGFKYEGTLRRNTLRNGRFLDDMAFGMLREEYKI